MDLYLGWAVAWGALPSLLGRTLPLGVIAVGAARGRDGNATSRAGRAPRRAVAHRRGRRDRRLPRSGAAAREVDSRRLARDEASDPAGARVRRSRARRPADGDPGAAWWLVVAARDAKPAGSPEFCSSCCSSPALLGLAAVQEFAVRGSGTPVPFDPPKRLVTTGPYAYVRNPMQLSAALVMLGWGAILGQLVGGGRWPHGGRVRGRLRGRRRARATSIAASGCRGARTRRGSVVDPPVDADRLRTRLADNTR